MIFSHPLLADLLLADFGVSFYIGLAISIAAAAASYAMSLNAASRQKKPRPDISPPNVTTQGAIVPIVVGKARVPGVVLFVGNRSANRQGGGRDSKGKKKPVTGYVYAEDALHALCVGPATRLQRIWADGKVIWTGDITPDTDAAGSTIPMPAGVAASFQIYWGGDSATPHAPAAPELDDLDLAGNIDASIFPRVCMVRWNGFGLGGSPRWPTIEYEVTRLPVGVGGGTVNPCSYMETRELVSDGGKTEIMVLNPSGTFSPTTGAETITGDSGTGFGLNAGWHWLASLGSGIEQTWARVGKDNNDSGNVLTITAIRLWLVGPGGVEVDLWDSADDPELPLVVEGFGSYTCWSPLADTPSTGDEAAERIGPLEYVDIPTTGFYVLHWSVSVTKSTTFTSDPTFDAQVVLSEITDPVFALGTAPSWLSELLYDPAPAGLGLGTDEIDETSVDDVIAALDAEGLDPPSIVIPDGESIDGALGEWMLDMGVALRWNPATGQDEFFLVREDAEAWTIPAEATEGPPPEIESFADEVAANAIVFSFPDASRNYRDTVIARGADGLATLSTVTRARKVQIRSVVDFDAAAKIAMRRSQEELGNLVQYTFELARGAARIRVGERIALPDLGITTTLRVLTTRRDQDGNRTTVKALVDSYGVPVVTHTPADGGGTSNPAIDPTADLAFTFVEAPPHLALLAGIVMPSLLILRVRANASILGAAANLSNDGTNYYDSGRDAASHVGFQLQEGIAATDAYSIEDGPLATLLGPDVDQLQDLTADEAAWREGRQFLVIGEELFYLRNAELISGTTYRLHGLLRARLGTARGTHAISAKGYVGTINDTQNVNDPMLRPGASIRLKSQPFTSTFLSLASITAVTKTLKGKGVTPPPVCALEVAEPALGVPAYHTGENVVFSWAYSSPQILGTGAGMQPAGSAVGSSPVQGEFEIEVYDALDVLVRTELRSLPTWTYANADLVADLGGETNFTVSVRNINGGYRSPARTLLVEAL